MIKVKSSTMGLLDLTQEQNPLRLHSRHANPHTSGIARSTAALPDFPRAIVSVCEGVALLNQARFRSTHVDEQSLIESSVDNSASSTLLF
eukprot:m.360488 g.360488  ORF g.360488 m.360488 type:complete len:90 (+) comp19065_c0_seq1:1239-1508(+)